MHAQQLSPVQLFLIPWTVATQALLSMEFSRQKYWSELPFYTSGDRPNPGIKAVPLVSSALAGKFFTTEPSVVVAGGLVAKLCLTLCDSMDCSLLGSTDHGISQTRTLE